MRVAHAAVGLLLTWMIASAFWWLGDHLAETTLESLRFKWGAIVWSVLGIVFTFASMPHPRRKETP